jgi:hypothetical protein
MGERARTGEASATVMNDPRREHDLTRRRLLGSAVAAAVGLGAVGESPGALAAAGAGKIPRSRRALM